MTHWLTRNTVVQGAVLLALIGCTSEGGPVAPPSAVATISISTPAVSSDAFGDTVRFTAQAMNADGAPVGGAPITWSVSPASVATISATGLLSTHGNGNAVVTARSGMVTAMANFAVTQRPVRFTVSRDSVTLDRWADTATIALIGYDRLDAPVAGLVTTLSSSNTAVATASASGASAVLLRSGGGGTASISITTPSNVALVATVAVEVATQRNPQCTVPPAVVARGAAGAPVDWTMSVIDAPRIAVPDSGYEFPISFPVSMDVDDDGDADVVAPWFIRDRPDRSLTSIAGLQILLNNAGVFEDASASLWTAPSNWVNPRVSVVTDANGDGKDDLLLLDTGYDPNERYATCASPGYCFGARNTLLLGAGASGLSDGTSLLATNAANGFSHAGDAADIDCDGDADAFDGTWANASAPGLSHLLVNNGSSLLADDSRVPSDLLLGGHVGFTWCDIDRDGDADAVSSQAGRRLRVLVNNGFGNFRLLPTAATPEAAAGDSHTEFAPILCGDWDGDGWNDLAMSSHRSSSGDILFVLLNNQNATFRNATSSTTTTSDVWLDEMSVADFNRDGWPDIFAASPGRPQRIFYGSGGGGFQEYLWPSAFWVGPGVSGIVADYTGDGRPDIVIWRGPFEHVLLTNR